MLADWPAICPRVPPKTIESRTRIPPMMSSIADSSGCVACSWLPSPRNVMPAVNNIPPTATALAWSKRAVTEIPRCCLMKASTMPATKSMPAMNCVTSAVRSRPPVAVTEAAGWSSPPLSMTPNVNSMAATASVA